MSVEATLLCLDEGVRGPKSPCDSKEAFYALWICRSLAEKADLHLSFIGQIERGFKDPSLQTLGRIAEVLKTDPGSLVGEAERRLKSYPIEKKFAGIISGRPTKEQQALYQTLKTLARQMRKMSTK